MAHRKAGQRIRLKAREQVRQELIQAQRDGIIPSGKNAYPPTRATIERNRARVNDADPRWASQS
ncbi:DUF4148 domain-containing protein [Paraburkholderia fungorum]|uniref:DUF4148 domain-containing protein n=1 Tax=Paraburkholderia fungorum TaxID=134537 RepID=UPI003313D045